LLDKLLGVLDDQQRKNKIRNLVYAMSKKEKTIENQGTSRYPKWVRTGKFWAKFRQTLDKLGKMLSIHAEPVLKTSRRFTYSKTEWNLLLN
jgi:hypothetical protein